MSHRHDSPPGRARAVAAVAADRRRRRPARPSCEPLEGRALCSALAGPDGRAAEVAARRAALQERLADRLENRGGAIPRPTPRRPSGPGAAVVRNVVFRVEGDRPERLDVYLPSGTAPAGGWPVVVAIHGGGWRRFSKEQYAPKVAPLTASGFAVVLPNYSTSAPGRPSWPENVEDVREAVRWVRRNAPRFGFDAGRVAAIGESSGGHLALMLGTDGDVPGPDGVSGRVDAVVDFYGPAELAELVVDSGGGPAAVQMLGGPPSALPDRYRLASPTRLASPGDAPTLIVHGTADTVVSFGQSQRLAAALEAAGVPTRFVVLPGAAHGFGPFDAGGALAAEVVGFLRAFA